MNAVLGHFLWFESVALAVFQQNGSPPQKKPVVCLEGNSKVLLDTVEQADT
jgi:hypothetical protein